MKNGSSLTLIGFAAALIPVQALAVWRGESLPQPAHWTHLNYSLGRRHPDHGLIGVRAAPLALHW